MGMKVVVSGGAGLIGSLVCERLVEQGHHVTVLDNFITGYRTNLAGVANHSNFSLIEHDVVQPWPTELQPQQIYHLACPASPVKYQLDPVSTIQTCVTGTINALELARSAGARIALSSTSEIYGDPHVHPQSEGYWGNVNSVGPRSCYEEGKRCGEALLTSYRAKYGIETRIARLFNTYGPRLHAFDGRVISNFVRQALANEDITIFGAGTHTRSFCYVTDTVSGIMKLMNSDVDLPVNLGNPHEVTIMELAKTVIRLAGSQSRFVYEPLPGDDPQRRKPDIARAKKLLDWQPVVQLEEGLRETIDHYLSTSA